MNKNSIIAGVIIIAVVVGGAFVLMQKSDTNSSSSSSASSSTSASSTITYSSNGFSPATITVKAGDTVAIKNTSNEDMQLDSDPHPVHTDDTDLNVGLVTPGQTKTFTVTKKGSFGYHNHLDPGDKGKIVVE